MKFIDLTGKIFGYLKVLEKSFIKNKHIYWKCQCRCNKIVHILGTSLKGGKTKSCGCYKQENNIGKRRFKHGQSNGKNPLYGVWNSIKQRIFNPNHKDYHNYRGRGIKICKEWLDDYKIFYSWAISNGYQKGLEIDRIDNDGNYEPDNCKWSTRTEQALNKQQKSNSGYPYIYIRQNKYVIIKRINGIKKYFGSFESAQEAQKHIAILISQDKF